MPCRPIPINVAEAILEPFWTPDLSGLDRWTVDPDPGRGLRVFQNWGAVDYEWTSPPAAGPALAMERALDADCGDHDRLVVCMALPDGARLRVLARTEAGERQATFARGEEAVDEHALPLDGARHLQSLRLEIHDEAPGGGGGWLLWVGLQRSDRIDEYLSRWDYSGLDWSSYLVPESEPLRFEPRYGICLPPEELASLRRQHEAEVTEKGESAFTRRALALK